MHTPQQPFLDEEVDFHALEPVSSHASLQPIINDAETIPLVSISSSVQDIPGLSSSSPRDAPSAGDNGGSPACTYLLPRSLGQGNPKRHWAPHCFECLLVLVFTVVAGVCGSLIAITAATEQIGLTDCEGASAKGVEKGFLVNIYVASELSFTRAKLLDLAWDTIIGQGLRLCHGWVVYHVISRALTAVMESDALPHRAYLDLQFSTISFTSIFSSVTLLFTNKPVRASCLALWSIFGIGLHTYAVSGITFVSPRSPELTQCWVFEDDRITSNGTTRVITGPQAGSPSEGRISPELQSWREPLYNSNDMDEFLDVYSYTHNPTGCISDTGYSWGFSGGVLGVALMLEGIWVFMTWTMWRWARARSTMVFMRRTGAGTIRNILDAAEAITEHLGDQHSAYTEKELSKQLQSSPPFGYVLETRNGVQHIGLRPIPTPSGDEETVLRKRAMVEHDTLYG
ncbi:hypothetical protein PG987_003635 [Apiospora arundinis]